jgi:hypothetical protein
MVSKQYPGITRFLAVSLALLITVRAGACGWGDDYETLRLAFFKADTPGMEKFKPAYYTEHYLNTDVIQSGVDRLRNCAEWQHKLGEGVLTDDIYQIQYNTPPEEFRKQYDAKQLKTHFKGNTFIKALLRTENKAYLQYLIFAKEMEYEGGSSQTSWESWEEEGPHNYWDSNEDTIVDYSRFVSVEKRLAACKDRFLEERYAFMLIRYGRKDNVVPLYNRYFENSTTTTVLKSWALLFRAYAANDKAEQNYYLSRCFDLCDEKIISVLQRYNLEEKNNTLKLAKNDHERAVIIAIHAMRDPGPVFNAIKEVNRLAPGSEYVNLLIGREVNKFEDWLFYAQMKNNAPEAYSETWEGDSYMDARAKNYRKDIKYLRSFRKYLIELYDRAAVGNNRDFMAAALAHLSFMDDNIQDGYKYASAISDNAKPSIQVQKYTELALVNVKQNDITTPEVKQQLYNAFTKIQEIAITDSSYNKSLFTLLTLLAAEYNKKEDIATANLLFLKADIYKYTDYGYNPISTEKFSYTYLGYLDKYAKSSDVDNLITLIDKKNKTPFEKFMCEGTTTVREYYLDFKGRQAFRENNLKLAYETLKQIPDTLARDILIYAEDESIDPFFPAILDYGRPAVRNQKKFSKLSFIKEVTDLENKIDANSYIRLGHAYYNTSYRGNAWFMNTYYQGSVGREVTFGSLFTNKKQYSSGNYTHLTLAHNYYMKAFKAATNNEQRAMAVLMLHACERNSDYTQNYPWEEKVVYKPTRWVKDFYGKYNSTATFKRYSCPDLEYYLR